ncbi:hypothetical protein C8A03DRAFT_16945 [Achaetomium macrosporum]|uniref:von Willebrand domain-containing protein n=1 Tax=Achaetomium macrosporum TaxID=79813 RepID=A0AAN7C7K9_9PEZI|nr:hypothetical protein C8A03DRAFT_16945 [Achaetomium macrosporum]
MTLHDHVCGLYYVSPSTSKRIYLPQLTLSVHATIVFLTSRTTLTQTFVNPGSDLIPELRYTFPLYEGVCVVGFVCTINNDRVIRGVVKERAEAKQTYEAAVDRGETAGLLEQLPEASDVFTTTVGNIPANATVKVEITYLGELKHDAEVDGIRFTLPTHIAPRYGSYPGQLLRSPTVTSKGQISIVVDVDMPDGSNIKTVQSPSHRISVTMGNTSAGAASGADWDLRKASATLALPTTELGDDFVLLVVAANTKRPIAVLETHPTIPNHRALMVTLVPQFYFVPERPEIVFVCDRSGSMGGKKIANLKTALNVFLKSIPVGTKFNICSFGTAHEFLFPSGSRTYDASTLEEATRYVNGFAADFGGTDIYHPMEQVFKKRYVDMDLEVFLLTDGDVWNQGALFDLLNRQISESKGRIRVFTLGIGRDVSHALIEGVAAAGNGFSQAVGENENMSSKVVRMLKAALTPHISEYALKIKYGETPDDDEGFEIITEEVMDALTVDVQQPEKKEAAPKKPISLFDETVDPDVEMTDPDADTFSNVKYSHVPPISEPKILQAPFVIPPLFALNRTSVYLLLSPETPQKQPTSVVLRSTSPGWGPLRQEIPVSLQKKGETIHQLAARKAVKELEQGRGWICHARDAKDPAGPLFKDKYPGRFTDMVEREAVRLGVTYQVGGKWCSFVAVEANQQDAARGVEHQEHPIQPESPCARDRDRDRSLHTNRAMGAGVLGTRSAVGSFAAQATHPVWTNSALATAPAQPRARLSDGSDDGTARWGSVAASSSSPVSAPDYAAMSPTQRLNTLVSLQAFDGAWHWEERLMLLLGLDRELTAPRAAGRNLGEAGDRLATALVLAFFEVELKAKEEEWEMVAEKAREWLEEDLKNGGPETLEAYMKEVTEFLKMEHLNNSLVREANAMLRQANPNVTTR